MMIKRRIISDDIEEKILTGLIVSTEFCKSIKTSFKKEYFQIDYVKRISQWVLDYFDKYSLSPNKHIEDIYKIESVDLDAPTQSNIEKFLRNLSTKYDRSGSNMNVNYLVDQTKAYFKTRALKLLFDQGYTYINAGKPELAEDLLDKHKVIVGHNSSRFNPFDEETINSYCSNKDSNKLFKMSGKIGEYLGYFERSWLVSFAAPEKRGKSYTLLEIAIQAALSNLQVLYVSLEMNNQDNQRRFYSRITGKNYYPVEHTIFPVMDCYKNQIGVCQSNKRTNSVTLRTKKKKGPNVYWEKPEYNPDLDYKICTVCRGRSAFVPTYWFEEAHNIPAFTTEDIKKKSKEMRNLIGKNLVVKTFPAYSANSKDIKNELEELEFYEDFTADVLVVDYVDILGIEDKSLSERGNVDATWKQFKNLAASRNILVVTVEQSNKASNERENIKVTDVTEDKRKNAHVDMKIAINQTEKENIEDVLRLSIMLNRHGKPHKGRQALILRCLDLGQPIIDSDIIKYTSNK